LRPEALPDWLGDAAGEVALGDPVVTVLLAVGTMTIDWVTVAFIDGTTYTEETEETAVVCVEATSVVETATDEVTEAAAAEVLATEAADVAEPDTGGMLNETPAALQRPSAAVIVFCRSAAEQAAWTHGVNAATKPEAWQIHLTSVVWHPTLPKLLKAQVRAHCGI